MTRGMYAAAGGMLIGLSRNDILSSNLANANTPGFKIDRVSYGSFQQVLLPLVTDENGETAKIMQSATLNASRVDLAPGPLRQTDNALDLALEGDGWFVVQTPAGERYTRNGHFSRDPAGTLVDAEQNPVLGENGPILLPNEQVTVDQDGVVYDGLQPIDRLRRVEFTAAETVTKEGGSRYGGGTPVPSETGRVRQGWLENSNADAMRTMVEMIGTMRSYEMNQRIIQAQDQTLQHVIDIARR